MRLDNGNSRDVRRELRTKHLHLVNGGGRGDDDDDDGGGGGGGGGATIVVGD
jgi:hypothetical protein